jgi:hypothetical protein
MPEIVVNIATYTADDGTTVTLRRQPDGTYAVASNSGGFLVKDYDTGLLEAAALSGEVAKLVPAKEAVEAAQAELAVYVDTKRAEFEAALPVDELPVDELPVEIIKP